MRVGLPVWEGRVSPVLDTAARLLVVETDSGTEAGRGEVGLEALVIPRRVAAIAALELDALICGALSRPLADMLSAAGVDVVPWVAGEVEEVLRAYASGALGGREYRMPGCCERTRRRRRQRRGSRECGRWSDRE
jgi:predicted Fe-Mo cluster-binding NifX family protein